jgi:hypothetical protein
MFEKTQRKLVWLAVAFLIIGIAQTFLLASIWQEMVNIRVENSVLLDNVRTIARNQP